MNETTLPSHTDPLAGQPYQVVERDGVRYTLLGTAHVSKTSVDTVRAAIASGAYDTIAVELDAGRLHALTNPDQLAKLDQALLPSAMRHDERFESSEVLEDEGHALSETPVRKTRARSLIKPGRSAR